MKKFLLALTAILCVTILNAQRVTKDYRFSNITGIKASSIYNIKLSKGNSDVVKITADERFFKNIKIYKEGNNTLVWNGMEVLSTEAMTKEIPKVLMLLCR